MSPSPSDPTGSPGSPGSPDLVHLRRCVELAAEALDAGHDPFGSVLVDASGVVRREERNAVGGGDATRHPELALAQWAAGHLSPEERRQAGVYTSGEHCPMCAAAHGWVGLGRVVYAVSAARLTRWQAAWGAPDPAVRPLPISEVVPGLAVEELSGAAAEELLLVMHELHRRRTLSR